MAGTTKSIPVMLAAVLFAAAPAAGVECVKPGGPGPCFATIQEAVDNATAGELIAIYPGVYRGSVTIPFDKPALKLVGKGRKPTAVRIDGSRGGPHGIQVQDADDVVIKNLTVQGFSGPGITGMGNGATVSRVRVFASASICVDLSGEDVRVLGTSVRGCGGPGISIGGPNGLVSGSSVAIAPEGITVGGDGGRVLSSRVSQVGAGIRVMGSGGQVRSSRVTRAASVGIEVFGATSPVKVVGNTVLDAGAPGIMVEGMGGIGGAVGEVSGNVVSGAMGYGLRVGCPSACDGSSVAGNRVSGVFHGSGIEVNASAAGLLVRDNASVSNLGQGFRLGGTGLKVVGNTAKFNGEGFRGMPGYSLDGTAHEVRRNIAVGNVSDGFRIEGAGYAAFEDNVARGNYGNGIVVEDNGLTLTGCTATGNFVLGIHVASGATGTTLTGCTAKANKGYDFCDEGTGTTAGPSNTFGTTCPP